MAGFEPTTPASQTRCSTKLSYIPCIAERYALALTRADGRTIRQVRSRARSHSLVGLLVASLLAFGAGAAPASAAPCKYRDLKPRSSNLVKIRSAVRCLINRERTKRGVPALKNSSALGKAAASHSKNMVSEGFFGHNAPDGSTLQSRISAAGYPGTYTGENIAWGSGSLGTPGKIVSRWMSSSGHKRNILDATFRDWGVGVAIGGPQGESGATYTTTFGATQ